METVVAAAETPPITDTVVVRIARTDDVPAIVGLIDAGAPGGVSREAPADLVRYREAFEEMQLDPNVEMLVLDLEGRVVGTVTLCYCRTLGRQGMRRCTVESVHVAADLRGQGLGGVLMQSAIDLAQARGCGMLQLTTDKRRKDAHRFYERLGFVASHEGMKLPL